ncbi:hypothetical protein HA466_0139550 [Hirschfeldia incana]|nr:hypothetical protein HA466_0139550 [Hirschfeldia incana]
MFLTRGRSFSVRSLWRRRSDSISVTVCFRPLRYAIRSDRCSDIISAAAVGTTISVHRSALFNPSVQFQGLEFSGLDLPDSVGEFVVSGVLVLQCEKVLQLISLSCRQENRKAVIMASKLMEMVGC